MIECDNYAGLKFLQYGHKNKIDLIYIDPPYNTGNKDWKYNDKFVDAEDAFHHSKWLSFMEKRLKLAKNLLSDKGVIFISIGDDEVAQLTLLCDEIFGNSNRIGIVPRITKRGSNKGKFFAPSKDFILAYKASNRDEDKQGFIAYKTEEEGEEYVKQFKLKDEVGIYKEESPNGEFVIPPGESFPTEEKDAAFIKPKNNNDKVWRWSYETYLKKKDDLITFKQTKSSPLLNSKGEKATYNIYVKSYLEGRLEAGTVPRDFIENHYNQHGTAALKDLEVEFDYPKPPDLIKYLIKIAFKDDKNITILDFFAGSGTTGQAVVELNSEDNGARKCILMTNNESDICEKVTWKRLGNINKGTAKYDKIEHSFTYFRLNLYKRNEIESKRDIKDYLPLISTFEGEEHSNWEKIDGSYKNINTAVITDKAFKQQKVEFLKKGFKTLYIMSDGTDDFEDIKTYLVKYAEQIIQLPKSYIQFFNNFTA